MVICPECGKDVIESKFCQNCGARLPENVEKVVEEVKHNNFCPNCGSEMDGGAEACSNCGYVIDNLNGSVQEETEEVFEEVNEVVDVEPVEPVNNDVKVTSESNENVSTHSVSSKFCQNCGEQINRDAKACPYCGFQFESVQTKFCQTCGEKINVNAEICPHCGVRVMSSPVENNKNIAVAVILSLILPGLGLLYLNFYNKGVIFIVAYIISVCLILILIGLPLTFCVWAWSLIDTVKTFNALEKGETVEDKLF